MQRIRPVTRKVHYNGNIYVVVWNAYLGRYQTNVAHGTFLGDSFDIKWDA